MGDRLLVKVVHYDYSVIGQPKTHCIGWLYQHWGANDYRGFCTAYKAMAKKMGTEYSTDPYDAVRTLMAVGDDRYGGGYIQRPGDGRDWTDKDIDGNDGKTMYEKLFAVNAELVKAHPDLLNKIQTDRVRCNYFAGTGDGYPDYIADWCERSVEIPVKEHRKKKK